ncbi:MAG: beta-lactamase family protein [Legionella sp.]|nr:beta-lactamase family protein [Legionella sp.]
MPEITGIDRELIESTMRKAHIPGVSIAYRDGKTTIPSTTNIGTTDTRDTSIVSDVQDDTVFGAASLSKPAFAYLVLKLIDKGVLKDSHNRAIGLDTPLHDSLSLDAFFQKHGEKGRDLQLMSQLPEKESRAQYKNSYVFIKEKDTQQLYYITPDEKCENVTIIDFNLFEKKINDLRKKDETKLHLSEEQIKEIVTSNGDYTHTPIKLSEKDSKSAETITPRMLLSHTSGLGIDSSAALSFTPGTEYAYSGTGLEYLQSVIQAQTEKSLGALAQEHVFGELALGMKKSRFVPPGASEDDKDKANAANSLFTTTSDYAKLMIAWMNDPSPIMQEAFKKQISLTQDNQRLPGETQPAAEHVEIKVKERLAWGLGVGLELDETGEKAVKAFHTGDMNQFRAQVALDLGKKSCIVYFANANKDLQANGHILAPLIIKPKIPIDYAHTWFYSKFPFALNVDQLPQEAHFGLRVQDKDKKADSDAVMAAFMPGGSPTPVPNSDATKEASDGSSYAVMKALMPTHSPKPALSSPEIREQSNVESPPTTTIEEEIQAETDRLSSPSPLKLTPKPSDYP